MLQIANPCIIPQFIATAPNGIADVFRGDGKNSLTKSINEVGN
jgi:hypothetical protein